jgi:hypothetical protein
MNLLEPYEAQDRSAFRLCKVDTVKNNHAHSLGIWKAHFPMFENTRNMNFGRGKSQGHQAVEVRRWWSHEASATQLTLTKKILVTAQ